LSWRKYTVRKQQKLMWRMKRFAEEEQLTVGKMLTTFDPNPAIEK